MSDHPLAQTYGGFCCPKCGVPFRETTNEATYPDGTEASGVVYTPACGCGVPVWGTDHADTRIIHYGDCTIFSSLANQNPWDGICTCGAGWRAVRTGRISGRDALLSDERKRAELPQ